MSTRNQVRGYVYHGPQGVVAVQPVGSPTTHRTAPDEDYAACTAACMAVQMIGEPIRGRTDRDGVWYLPEAGEGDQ